MTNKNKWLIAAPFALLVGVVVPGLVAREWLWFLDRWQDALYATLTVGMWLVATAFVDVARPRGRRDLANVLLPLGLVAAVPIAVWDHLYGLGRWVPVIVSMAAVVLGAAAIVLGVAAWRALGPGYSPRPDAASDQVLVRSGPYRTIRHPLYLAALLWAVAWPLILGSVVAPGVALVIVLPAIMARMEAEEAALLRLHGQGYAAYCQRSWRLIPFLY